MNNSIDYKTIEKAVNVLHEGNELFEVRAIDGKWNTSGYFTSAETLIQALERTRIRSNANIYITLSVIKSACYSRSQHDQFLEYASPTTTDSDIEKYKWLMIDLDPKRASGTSSSEDELNHAIEKSREIFRYLNIRGYKDPIMAVSGNGVHLLYRIEMNNTPENQAIIKGALSTLNTLFSDETLEVDVKTYNPARVCKLYGTMAKKGADTPERPHRMSYIKYIPDEIQINDFKLLKDLSDLLQDSESNTSNNYRNNYNNKFDIDEFIDKYNIPVKSKSSFSGGTKYILEHCLFDESHKGKDAAIICTNDGKLGYNCFHNSCADKHWKDVRLMFEPNYESEKRFTYVNENIKPNHLALIQPRETKTQEPAFLTTEQIRNQKKPNEEFLKSGINLVDNKMRGLKKGFVTCLSGLRGCGKSSIISQISLNLVENGFNVALFSGELTGKNVLKWLTLQAAGKKYVLPTQYENYFTYSPETAELISKWLDNKIYIYNNDWGNKYDEIERQLENCINSNKVDLVILDNLMSMNLSNLDNDKYSRQSRFVERLEILAKELNVHIIFVAHPRKSQGFLRLDDVAGSNDIVNRVDNAFIMHRVNEDFKRLTKDMYRWKEDNPLYQCSNVIEICKDRDGGIQDEFIPLYFERETKRLKNSEYENIVYSWNKSKSENTAVVAIEENKTNELGLPF